MYRIIYRRQARNYLARLPLKIKSRIKDKLHELQKDSDNTNIDVDKLKGEAGYRLRVGPYRILYTRDRDQLIIEMVKVRTRGISTRGRDGISNNKRKRQSKIRGSAG